MEALKIALASDWFYPKTGGIETHIHELALYLLKAGHEPHVITHDYRKFGRFVDRFPYKVHRFSGELYSRRTHVSVGPLMAYRINEFYKSERFDLTHVHSIYSPLGITVANISRGIRGVPAIATNHSLFEWGSPAARLWLPLLRFALKRVDAVIAVSRVVARDTRRLLSGRRDKPVFIVPNAVDVRFWRPPDEDERVKARAMIGAGPRDFVLLASGRFTKRKRMHVVPRIAAAAWRIAASKSEAPRRLRLVIIGEGEYEDRVKEEAKKVSDKVPSIIRGFVERPLLRYYYWAADATILPSPLEAFPITALESMACGTPVIGFEGGGLSDLIMDGETGVLASSDEDAAERLAELILDEEFHARMRQKAPYVVARQFSWSHVIGGIIEIYRAVLGSSDPEEKLFLLYKVFMRLKGAWRATWS